MRNHRCPGFKILLLVILTSASMLFSSARLSGAVSFSRAKPLMGTIVEITVESENRTEADAIMDLAFQEIEHVDALMSSFRKDSEVFLLARQAGRSEPVKVSTMFMEVLHAAMNYYHVSDHAFDVTTGPLMRLWGFMEARKRVPSTEEISAARSLTGSEKIVMDAEHSTVLLPLKGMEIDLGGIAKGYAVDRAVAVLKASGISSGVVNAGGDLFVLGAPQCPAGWPVGIRHPLEKGKLLGWIRVKEMAVATSGNYENFFIQYGKAYSHIIDPRTGYPVQGVLSVTVLSPNAMEADAMATALFVLGPEKGVKLTQTLPGVEALIAWTDEKGEKISTAATPGFKLHEAASPEFDCKP